MKKDTCRNRLEKKTLGAMIRIYCRKLHGTPGGLCPDCTRLHGYALSKLDKCAYGGDKPNCSRCPIHCYDQAMRAEIHKVMRVSGPLMLRYHPVLAALHIARGFRRIPALRKHNERPA